MPDYCHHQHGVVVAVMQRLAEAFADVTPVPLQEQHGSPVCQIAYPEEFTQAYEYVRAVLSQNERSGTLFWFLFRIVALCLFHACLFVVDANFSCSFYSLSIRTGLGIDRTSS